MPVVLVQVYVCAGTPVPAVVAAKVCEYAIPVVPAVSGDAVLIVTVGQLIVIE
jgi:hypothetical protein